MQRWLKCWRGSIASTPTAITANAVWWSKRVTWRRPTQKNPACQSCSRTAMSLLVAGLFATILLMILPIHPFLLDGFLAMSIALSLLVLLAILYVREPADFTGFPTLLLVHHAVPALAQHRLHPADPAGRLRRAHHRGLRQLRRARQLRGRPGHLPDPRADQFHRHHQGRRAHRGSRGPFHLGRHARQTDGHRRRVERRHHQRSRGPRRRRRRSSRRPIFTARWTAPASSCAATPSPPSSSR